MNRLISFAAAGFLLCGCAHLETKPPTATQPAADQKLETRNNAASLLDDLMNDEKNVSKILIIKRHGEELGQLIKAISAMAAENQKQLERLRTNDPNLNLRAIELPPGEKAARDADAKTEEHELLFSSGMEFEFNLLLTQAQALSYGSHLAKIAAENSSLPEEVQKFTAMSRVMETLYGQVIARMRQNK
jgi:hypothetical protein